MCCTSMQHEIKREKHMKKIYIAAIVMAAALASCRNGAEIIVEDVTYSSDTVRVAAGSSILPKIVVEAVSLEPFASEFRTVGTVRAENGHYAEVGVPFDGRITRANVRLGSKVRAGETLFEMSSPEFLEASRDYFQSLRSYDRARADYQRKKDLMEYGLTSQKELDEAFTEAENARQDKEYAEATLRVYGTSPEAVKSGEPMKVISPVSGEVVLNNVTVGAFAKADDESLVTVADLSRVWVTALVKERFIGMVTRGAVAEIITEADPGNVIVGEIINVGNIVDEETRSVQVVVDCDNKTSRLKHGMYVSVHFLSESSDMIVVPSSAVFQGEQSSYVFVCTSEQNVYVRRDVTIGSANDDNSKVSIIGGLKPGDRVIVSGGLYLNS